MKVAHGRNSFCGPAVLSALLGIKTCQAAAEIRKISGQRAVRHTWTNHLLQVLIKKGWSVQKLREAEGLTINQTCRKFKGRAVLVVTPHPNVPCGHIIVINHGQVCDNCTIWPVSPTDYHRSTRNRYTDWAVFEAFRVRPPTTTE